MWFARFIRHITYLLIRFLSKAMSLLNDYYDAEYKMVFVVNMDLRMGRGKQCAQVAHAALGLYLDMQESANSETIAKVHQWIFSGQKKIVLKADNLDQLLAIQAQAKETQLPVHLVRDAGCTQIPPGSQTVLSIFGLSRVVDTVTGNLNLL